MPRKLTKGVLFRQDNAPAHKSVVAMAAVCDCGFWTGWSPPYSPDLAPCIYFPYVPQHEKTLGWEAVSDRFPTLLRTKMIPQEFKHCITNGKSVWTTQETLKNKSHLVKFDQGIIVSLWTFQPTLVCSSAVVYRLFRKPVNLLQKRSVIG